MQELLNGRRTTRGPPLHHTGRLCGGVEVMSKAKIEEHFLFLPWVVSEAQKLRTEQLEVADARPWLRRS